MVVGCSGRKERHRFLKVLPVCLVESGQFAAVDVQHGNDGGTFENGYHNLAAAFAGTGDVSGKLFHIRHYDCLFPGPCRAAHTFSFAYARACQGSLKRTQNKHAVHNPVESRPPETERLVQHACHIRHIGYDIRLAGDDSLQLRDEFLILLLLGACGHRQSF